MTLIKSISGIRGTIGGEEGHNLTPIDTVRFASAYGVWTKNILKKNITIIIGRDARVSGEMISALVSNTLIALGIDVIDIGLSTTPTVEMAVTLNDADGGIIITASHNPKEWNALKLLNNKGEFLDASEGEKILDIVRDGSCQFSGIDNLGSYSMESGFIDKHIQEILNLELVNVEAIKNAKFKVAVDAVNSTGGIAIPLLLEKLDVDCVKLYCDPTGHFPHNPEPLKEHLTDISRLVVKEKADLGIVVDPDVDRLAFVCEDGSMFGEEYTLVACADYVLGMTKGNTVSNLSSTKALEDITLNYGCEYSPSAVGEVNVIKKMKETDAIIGGEGNGGIIYPNLHYGRDALVGIALFLSHLAKSRKKISILRQKYPSYVMIKDKIKLKKNNMGDILKLIKNAYTEYDIDETDGLRISLDNGWIHLRESNTEPIVRLYIESTSVESVSKIKNNLSKLISCI